MAKRLRILIDENIPYGEQAFGGLGTVRTIHGRRIDRAAVAEADVLLVRSITRVDAALLDGSPVRFVGTATIGYEHVDREYLARRGIAFHSAPGSNANSVAEWLASSLLVLARRQGRPLDGRSIGVVGVGNVGSRVVRKCRALGMSVMECDPPRERRGDRPSGVRWSTLDEIARSCDVVTFHVPLEPEGPDATLHLAGDRFFAALRPGATFVNSSRGAVHDTRTLKWALESGRLGGSVIDVWEDEPEIDAELLSMVDMATPHVAGYSLDGKVEGVRMLHEGLCREMSLAGGWSPSDSLPKPEVPGLELDCRGRAAEELLAEAALAVYDPSEDDSRMRRIPEMPAAERGAYFDRLRKEYPVRREFSNTRVTLKGASGELRRRFGELGFTVER